MENGVWGKGSVASGEWLLLRDKREMHDLRDRQVRSLPVSLVPPIMLVSL